MAHQWRQKHWSSSALATFQFSDDLEVWTRGVDRVCVCVRVCDPSPHRFRLLKHGCTGGRMPNTLPRGNGGHWVVCCPMRNIFKLSKPQIVGEEGTLERRPQIFIGDVLRGRQGQQSLQFASAFVCTSSYLPPFSSCVPQLSSHMHQHSSRIHEFLCCRHHNSSLSMKTQPFSKNECREERCFDQGVVAAPGGGGGRLAKAKGGGVDACRAGTPALPSRPGSQHI